MSAVFGKSYSGAYDSLYGTKSYPRECDMIESLAALVPPARILDLGCGTGGHALRLTERGYDVTGIDRSAAMLEIARQKAVAANIDGADFIEGDLRTLALGKQFDAALMMFAVLGYQQTDRDVCDALAAVSRHLRAGAPFVFDIWYGPAVLADPPGARQRVIETPGGRIVRTTESRMESGKPLCSVNFTLEHFQGDALTETTQERHVMRYFFPGELEAFALEAGFRCEALRDFNDPARLANETTWNAVALFRKC